MIGLAFFGVKQLTACSLMFACLFLRNEMPMVTDGIGGFTGSNSRRRPVICC